ncbi:TPA: type-F conjugative transfer system pilin assembly protein TrbC [Legionella pneumophila]|uniref:Type-F conjugative transfer system pilin assembly protein TrbC n=1 Tax=Legionella pneumophila subsp. pneumophila TaxID=91891 RepID=A0A3A6UEG8_LEGPN|nr:MULTISPECIES: type-F conjugative transfer system pilin assembly protein TrbC [Legionella]HAT7809689.1 type-F conjugative transfer system pilin assembly protein TrbC [Legionella pneumophila]MBN5936162.1 type-F conjugative transfer system pilin assembly protein TrbC [Legionella anisa]RJY24228.1 type-F conjugative transfer system pilin assembly protein TrbC [Legionella pneumophila subsp. pneumophila]RJY24676.1 type-F conjugative transfer system pilin assembly protein TrbC [Legionella pneumophil
MLRKGIFLLIGCVIMTSSFAVQLSVFVSFSMPETLFRETLKESAQRNIPAYLNGLYRDSMSETALKVMALNKRIPNLNMAIDPTLFERFGIQKVPALVVDDGKAFDVIYGHLTIQEGLARMAGRGEVYFTSKEIRRLR